MTRMPIAIIAPLLFLPPAGAQPSPAAPAQPRGEQKADRQDVLLSEQFSEAVASTLLSRIGDGFVRRNPKLLLSAFDAQHFPGYPLFSERIRARLGQSYTFRAYYRIVNSSAQDTRATTTVELQIEQGSTTPGAPPTRNTGQATFTFERGAAGWRIVEVSPRDLLIGMRGPA